MSNRIEEIREHVEKIKASGIPVLHRDAQAFADKIELLSEIERLTAELAEAEEWHDKAIELSLKAVKDSIEWQQHAEKAEARLKEIIALYDEYIAFVNQENGGAVQIAWVHGWRCPDAVAKKGQEYRDKIEAIKKSMEGCLREIINTK